MSGAAAGRRLEDRIEMRGFRSVGLVWGLLAAVPFPGAAQIAVREGRLQQREARPGEVYSGTILVTNTTDVAQEVKLYQTDYIAYADGRALYGEPGTQPRSNAAWITVNPSFVRVPARGQLSVPYTVQVPPESRPPLSGSYWSVIMVEPVAAASGDSALAKAQPGVGLIVRIRYAVQVVTHIAGTGAARVEFENPRVVEVEGRRVLEVDLRNAGDRSAPLQLRLELFDAGGRRMATEEASVRILHPGGSVRQRFGLAGAAGGTYQVMITADTGEDLFGAQYTLRL